MDLSDEWDGSPTAEEAICIIGQSAGMALVLDSALEATAALSINAIWMAMPVALQPRSGKRAMRKMTISRAMDVNLLNGVQHVNDTE